MNGYVEVGINDDDEAVSDTGTNDDDNDDLSSWRGTSSLEAQLVTDDPRMRRRTCSLYYVVFFPTIFFRPRHLFLALLSYHIIHVLRRIGNGSGFLKVVCQHDHESVTAKNVKPAEALVSSIPNSPPWQS